MSNNEKNSNLDPYKLIAAVGTLIAALLLLMFMILVKLQLPQKPESEPPSPLEMAAFEPDEPQEQFIEPLLLENSGEEQAVNQTEPAPAPEGTPDRAPQPNNKKVVNGQNPNPNPSDEKLVSSKQPSPKKTTEASQKNEPDSRIAANMKGQFSPHNGVQGGSTQPAASYGAGGTGTGVSGSLKGGRKLISYQLPTVSLRQKIVIKVEVYVNAEGRVTEANVLSGSSDPVLREKCRQASLKAVWSPQADAPRTRGIITWTLVPKI